MDEQWKCPPIPHTCRASPLCEFWCCWRAPPGLKVFAHSVHPKGFSGWVTLWFSLRTGLSLGTSVDSSVSQDLSPGWKLWRLMRSILCWKFSTCDGFWWWLSLPDAPQHLTGPESIGHLPHLHWTPGHSPLWGFSHVSLLLTWNCSSGRIP